jgi:hypothetical protein
MAFLLLNWLRITKPKGDPQSTEAAFCHSIFPVKMIFRVANWISVSLVFQILFLEKLYNYLQFLDFENTLSFLSRQPEA